MTTAIVPGSFDPFTLGHRYIVEQASSRYDRVIVAVMVNPEKLGRGLLTLEQRAEVARIALEDINNVEVTVREGWLADFAAEVSAEAIVKGYRNEADLKYEREMADFNLKRNPNCRTVLLPAPISLGEISSSEVRGRLSRGENISELVGRDAAEYIKRIINQ